MKFLSPVDQSLSAPDMVFRRLKDAITTGELQPGQKLPSEADLARSFQIAPMTVRVALAAMRDMGLMETHRGRNGGNFIASDVAAQLAQAAQELVMSRAELRDLTDWRRAVSGEACFLAAQRFDPELWQKCQAAASQFSDNLGQFPQLRFADARFHLKVAEMSNSARLADQEMEIQRLMTDVILAARKPVVSDLPTYDHGPILAAIQGHQAEAARQAMIFHAEDTFNWLTLIL